MYFLTSIICSINTSGLDVKNEDALNDTVTVMKLIFTPINSMIVLSTLGNVFGKLKDKVYDTSKAGKYLVILLIVFIVLIIFETNYIGNFIKNLLT